nr:autotransporter domain-containing protein [uncultured Rhodopila sp.]
MSAGTQNATPQLPSSTNGVKPAPRAGSVRAALLGGASMLVLAGGMLPQAALADQTVSSAVTGPLVADGSAITVTLSGAISGGSTGIAYGTITTLSNAGLISGNLTGIYGTLAGSIGTLSNQGTIVGTNNYGIGNDGSIGAATNAGGGTIGTISGNFAGIFNTGSFGTLTNGGAITGNTAGITNSGGFIGTLSNGGTIAGLYSGLSNTGTIGVLTNAGTISSTSGGPFAGALVGLSNGSGAVIGTLTNNGRISGLYTGISNSGSIGTLTNTGALISTATASYTSPFAGLRNAVTGVIGTLTNSGTIASVNYGVQNLGSIDSLTNSAGGTISGASGAIVNGTASNPNGTIGTLTNSGTISGAVYGVSNLGFIGTLNNATGGLIAASSRTAVYNASTIGALTNSGRISGHSLGVFNGISGSIGTLSNNGTIAGSAGAGLTNQGTTGTLSNSGTITGLNTAIANSGSIGTLTNSGAIITTGTTIASGAIIGLSNQSTAVIGTLDNSGTISGYDFGLKNLGSINSLTNSFTGSIGGRFGAIVVDNTAPGTPASIDVLTNNGLIAGGDNGIIIGDSSSGTLVSIGTLTNSGTISGGTSAIYSIGTIGTLTNSGLISGGSNAIYSTGTIGTLTNSGTINGGQTAIYNTGTIGTLTNAGTISGSQFAIYSSGSLGPVTNTGLIRGSILTTGQDLGITGGSGSTFGTLTGGTITVNGGNLNLAGNALLQDNVVAGTVTNSGNLKLTAKQTITGNYAQTGGSLIIAASNASAGGLVVSGWATMSNFTVTFDPLPGLTMSPTTTYVVVDAAVGADTSYSGYSVDAPTNFIASLGTLDIGAHEDLILTLKLVTTNIIPAATQWASSALGITLNPVFEGGTLRLDEAGATYAQNFTLNNAATNTIDQYGNTVTFSGVFSDAVAGTPGNIVFTNTGSGGEVFLTGNNTYTGATTIESGAKVGVEGTLLSPVTVDAGGTLRGTGTIGGTLTVASGGTLAPGNSPGTLTITAPVTLAAGSTASFDIDGTGTGSGAGNYSRLVVTSTVTVGGTLVPVLRGITGNASNTYVPPIGQAFQVITASGGLTGSFSSLTQPDGLAPNTRFDALYGATALDLVVTPASYAIYAGNNWAAPVGAGLDAARPAAGVAMTAGQEAVYAPLYVLSAEQIVPALDWIAPVIYADTLMVDRQSYQMVEGAVNDQLQARRGAPAATGAQTAAGPGGTTIWLAGNGQFINQDNAANGTPGYSGSAGGVVAGIDGTVLPGLRLGLAAGFYSQSVNSAYAASYQGASAQIQLYAGYQTGVLFVDAQAGTVFDQGNVRRSLPIYSAAVNNGVSGFGLGASVRGGARLAVGAWTVEPSLTFSGSSLSQNSLSESGAGAAGMHIGDSSIGSFRTTAAVEVDRRFALGGSYVLVPSVRLGWAYEALDTSAPVKASFLGAPGSGFVLTSASIGRSAAVAGLHAVLETGTAWQVFGGYDAAFNGKASEQSVAGGLSYRF